jgi:hypothetical protein
MIDIRKGLSPFRNSEIEKRGQPLKKDIMCGRVLVYVLGRG